MNIISKLTFRNGFTIIGVALVEYLILTFGSIACSGYPCIPSFLMIIYFITLFTATLGCYVLICAIIRKLIDMIINNRRKNKEVAQVNKPLTELITREGIIFFTFLFIGFSLLYMIFGRGYKRYWIDSFELFITIYTLYLLIHFVIWIIKTVRQK